MNPFSVKQIKDHFVVVSSIGDKFQPEVNTFWHSLDAERAALESFVRLLESYQPIEFLLAEGDYGKTVLRRVGRNHKWGIFWNDHSLSKYSKEFVEEPADSSKDKKFFQEFRWNSFEEAVKFWESL